MNVTRKINPIGTRKAFESYYITDTHTDGQTDKHLPSEMQVQSRRRRLDTGTCRVLLHRVVLQPQKPAMTTDRALPQRRLCRCADRKSCYPLDARPL